MSSKGLVTLGGYSPFVVGIFAETYGFLLQWPIRLTLVMIPILATVYSKQVERVQYTKTQAFGDKYRHYRMITLAFIPSAPFRKASTSGF